MTPERPAGNRVALVAPEFPPAVGGMQTYGLQLAKGLVRRGYEVTVLTREAGPADLRDAGTIEPILAGKWYLDRGLVRARRSDFDTWHVLNAAYAWVALEADRVFVSVHGNDLLSPNPIAPLDLGARWGLPWSSRADFAVSRWRTRRLVRRGLARTRHVFSNSRATAKLVAELFPVSADRISVALVGVDPLDFSPSKPDTRGTGPTRLLTVARLSEPRKNVDRVLRALADLKNDHEFVYRVVGEGHLKAELQELAKELGLEDRVEFLAGCSHSDLAALYAPSDLFILTSSHTKRSIEGFGIVYLEANAAGTPVLAADCGGATEAVVPGETGLLINEPSVEAITDALSGFLDGTRVFDPEDCRRFAARFSWDRVVDHVVAAYESSSQSE